MAKKTLKTKGIKIPKEDIKMMVFLAILIYMAILGVCLIYRSING